VSAIESGRSGSPRVTVVVLAYRTVGPLGDCLTALAAQRTSMPHEVVVVLNGASAEASAVVERFVHEVRVVTSGANLGFAGGANLGARGAGGDYLVFLNDDVVPEPDWLDELVGFADGRPHAGAVGSLVLFPDGSVQEAGGVIWKEGNTAVVGRGDEPGRPDIAFARRVDYASACALLVRRAAWDEVGGFDEGYFPAYYEDVDLCMGLRGLGWEVWFTPTARVRHLESASAGSAKRAMFEAGERRFKAKWAQELPDFLSSQGGSGAVARAAARARGGGRRVLVIDDRAPRLGMGSGFDRMLAVIDNLTRRNVRVVFHPSVVPGAADLGRLGVEIVDNLDDLLDSSPTVFDAIIASRPNNVRLALRVRTRQRRAALIYDAEALYSRQFDRLAALVEDDAARERALRRADDYRAPERSIHTEADIIVTIAPEERDWFTKPTGCPVTLLPPLPERPQFTPAPFAERRGAVFVSGWLAGMDSPNAHGFRWFAREVVPRLRARVPWASVRVTGAHPPELVRRHASSTIEFVGHVDDIAEVYGSARVAISPILWGAGVKLKTVEALAHGVPVVATTIGAEGMPERWHRQVDIADDPERFANTVAALLEDRSVWEARRSSISSLLEGHRFDLGAEWVRIIDRAVDHRRAHLATA
jgi:GT2 family glycosyltransferase